MARIGIVVRGCICSIGVRTTTTAASTARYYIRRWREPRSLLPVQRYGLWWRHARA